MMQLINKTGMTLILLGLFTSGCVKSKPFSGTLLKTRPVEDVSRKGPEKETSQQAPSQVLKLDAVMRRFQKAISALQQGRIEQARMRLETLRDQHPGVSVFHHNLGIVYKRLGQIEDAIKAYEQALGLNPDGGTPEAYYNLAIARREQGAFKKAENAYLVAIALTPDFEDAHFNLAVLYDLYLNDPEKALAHYQKQIELSGETDKEIEIWMAALQKRLSEGGSQK